MNGPLNGEFRTSTSWNIDTDLSSFFAGSRGSWMFVGGQAVALPATIRVEADVSVVMVSRRSDRFVTTIGPLICPS